MSKEKKKVELEDLAVMVNFDFDQAVVDLRRRIDVLERRVGVEV